MCVEGKSYEDTRRNKRDATWHVLGSPKHGWPSPGARPDALRPDGLEPGDQWVDGQMEPGGRMTWA